MKPGHPGQGHPHGHGGSTSGLQVVAWEVTRRCPLRCKHCRGAARDVDYAGELSTDEAKRMLDSIAAFAKPILILTGGEPMTRPDIYELADYAAAKGLRPVMSPCGMLIDDEAIAKIKASGIQALSISLDGATAETHDSFRALPGAFETTTKAIEKVAAAGIRFQINTTICKHNVHEVPQILELSKRLGAGTFNPFFLVPTGRGKAIADLELSPEEYEEALEWLAGRAAEEELPIRVTCAPHYYRIQHQMAKESGENPMQSGSRGCIGGSGFVFVSHQGQLQPCGFLELDCGNIRAGDFDFEKLYNQSTVFVNMRRRNNYGGKCGVCEYVRICGGCRARSHGLTGDYLSEEPYCMYIPRRAQKDHNADI